MCLATHERAEQNICLRHTLCLCPIKIFDIYTLYAYSAIIDIKISRMKQLISNPTQLGHLLASARKAKRLTQAEAGARVGLSQSRVSVLETDTSSLTVEQLLALTGLYELRIQVLDRVGTSPAVEW